MSAPAMKLVGRLRAISSGFSRSGNQAYADVLDAAIARIEAADALDGEMPRDLTPLTVADDDIRSSVAEYRALVREQDGTE